MSEARKNRLLAIYLIYVNAGLKISDGLREAVERIEKEKTASIIARA